MIKKIKLPVLFHFMLQFISRPIIKQKNKIRDSVLRHSASRRSLVLDFGCGEGIFSGIFRDEINITYVEVDKNADLLHFSKHNNKDNLYVISNEKLCFKNNTFDFIILSNVLHHMTQDEISQLMFEISRILNETGSVIVIELVPPNQQKWLHCRIITFLEERLKKIQYFQANTLNRFLNQFRLTEEKRLGHNFVQYVFVRKSENEPGIAGNN